MATTMPGRNGGTLKRSEKGETSNPNGRPPGRSWEQAYRMLVDMDGYIGQKDIEETDEKGKPTGRIFAFGRIKLPKQDMIALALMKKATAGDVSAIKLLMETMDGKPKQAVDLTTDGNELKLTLNVIGDATKLKTE